MTREEQTKAEMAKGAEVVLRTASAGVFEFLSKTFNPAHKDAPPPAGYASWEDFRNRASQSFLPNNRDGTPRNGT